LQLLAKFPGAPRRMNPNRGQTDKQIRQSVLARVSMKLRQGIATVGLAAGLAGCGAADLISNGLSYTRAVETDLQHATGVRPQVGFNWHNGSFRSVTVTFPRVYADKPLGELADTVREIVARDFKLTPDTIVLGFSLDK
jgi:hypothetical protein